MRSITENMDIERDCGDAPPEHIVRLFLAIIHRAEQDLRGVCLPVGICEQERRRLMSEAAEWFEDPSADSPEADGRVLYAWICEELGKDKDELLDLIRSRKVRTWQRGAGHVRV